MVGAYRSPPPCIVVHVHVHVHNRVLTLNKNIRAFFYYQFRPTLFGELTDDVSNHRFLALRVRAAGHPRTRGSYFVNVQTEGPTNDDLWQHRLYFSRDDGGWEDVFVRSLFSSSLARLRSLLVDCGRFGNQIPFDGFVMTKAGTINTQPVSMLRERIRSVGISLLGGNSGVEGPYELGIDEIRAVNDAEEDVTAKPRKLVISLQSRVLLRAPGP